MNVDNTHVCCVYPLELIAQTLSPADSNNTPEMAMFLEGEFNLCLNKYLLYFQTIRIGGPARHALDIPVHLCYYILKYRMDKHSF